MRRTTWARPALLVTAGTVLLATTATGSAGEQRPSRYEGSGATVVRVGLADLPTLVDEGEMRCSLTTGDGTGGSCVRFDPTVVPPAIRVNDATLGAGVAFQVCLDNDGDGFCTSPDEGPCGDDIVFSHSDGGAFFNPLSVPPGFRPGCPGGAFPGYVVFLCAGAHVDGSGGHTHSATAGTTQLVPGGTGTGNFCGGSRQNVSRKRYTVIP